MERTDATTLTVSTPESHNLMENDLEDSEGQSQMFRHPRRSRTQEALDEVLDGEDVTRVSDNRDTHTEDTLTLTLNKQKSTRYYPVTSVNSIIGLVADV